MPTPQELEKKFWSSIKSDRTVMLGLTSAENGHTRPMTAQIENDEGGPIWFFTSNETALVKQLGSAQSASLSLASKGLDLFASVQGQLSIDNDRAMIDKLWSPFVAAWFEGGKTDPKLALLRFDAGHAEIWENAHSLIAGIKMLLGSDPKKDYKDKVAEVNLRNAS